MKLVKKENLYRTLAVLGIGEENLQRTLAVFAVGISLVFLAAVIVSLKLVYESESELVAFVGCFIAVISILISYLYLRVAIQIFTPKVSYKDFWLVAVPNSLILLAPLWPSFNDGTFGVYAILLLFNAVWFYFLYSCYKSIGVIMKEYQNID